MSTVVWGESGRLHHEKWQQSVTDLSRTIRSGSIVLMAAKQKTRTMTDEHKAALAEGRAQGRAVRRYLEALEANKPKRGRKRTPDSMKKRLEKIGVELETADPLKRLQLTQEQLDLEAELAAGETTVDLSALEQEFVASAAGYAARKGISYHAFRAVGVSPAVLRAAGISRSA
jgi:hypothetical protein